MLSVAKDGYVSNSKIRLEKRPLLEQKSISAIRAIVLHRTNTITASSVLNAWKTKKEGTHFLISETGQIYQTACLKKQCWHVGKLYSRCRSISSCSKTDATTIETILQKKNTSWGKKFRLITRHELKKPYPLRFPHNHDSIGIEVVGQVSKVTEMYEIPNPAQQKAVFWLLDELVSTYSISLSDIYAHGQIAHKDEKKSEGAATHKAYTLFKNGAP